MAQQLTIRDNAVEGALLPGDIVGNTIFVSDEQSNTHQSFLYKAAEIAIVYDNLVATGQVSFQGIVEGKNLAGQWFPVGYQFNSFRDTEFDRVHTIVVDPNIFWPDAGSPNIIWVEPRVIGEVSPQQIALPETWRICIHINQPSGSTFTSLDCSISAELSNPQ